MIPDPTTPLHLRCTACEATNRVPAARLDDAPGCGRCGRPLLQGQVLTLTDADFDAVLAGTSRPVLVDFWAAWCGPCRQMVPGFEAAARQLAGQALLAKVDTDANPALSQRFAIRSIPTLIRFERGREAARQAGALPVGAIVGLAQGH